MIGRFISWITNEVIVKNLANNRNFQKFAVRIDSTIQKNKKMLQEGFSKENLDMVKDRLGKNRSSCPANLNHFRIMSSKRKEPTQKSPVKPKKGRVSLEPSPAPKSTAAEQRARAKAWAEEQGTKSAVKSAKVVVPAEEPVEEEEEVRPVSRRAKKVEVEVKVEKAKTPAKSAPAPRASARKVPAPRTTADILSGVPAPGAFAAE
ncbi:hypothetical protein B484DRAFT_422305 [Ochromonadaceae sp. CCMP2298]|nr:hypothetical protein B484DRAFT_422305 [Ochromonadaceae sp. CCMP2298]